MAISFNDVPAGTRVPFTYVEFDNSQAIQGPSIQTYKMLMFGQKISSGTAVANTPVVVTSVEQAATLFGATSMLRHMVAAALDNNSINELTVIPVADNGAGVAATGSIEVDTAAGAAGTYYLWVAGVRYSIATTAAQTSGQLATAIAAAIEADTTSPISAAVDGSNADLVNFTCDHKGIWGNYLDIRSGYYADEKALPGDLAVTITAFADGAGNPDLTSAIAAIPDEQYHIWINPYNDSANLALLDAELLDRWGPNEQIDGLMCMASNVSSGSLTTLGESLNSKHISIMEATSSPTSPYMWAAAYGAVLAYYAQIDPARPFQTLQISSVLAPEKADRFSRTERNLLLFDGIATHYTDASGNVLIERAITTYRLNASGGSDVSYLDANTIFTLSYIRYDFRTMIAQKYPRHKLASDGQRIAPGQAIMTPSLGKAEAVAKFKQWEELGLVENSAAFKEGLIVERNISDVNRLDWKLTPDLINQLRQHGVQIAFLL